MSKFTVVLRGPSAVIIKPEESLQVTNFLTSKGRVDMQFRTRWIKSNSNIIPGHMWIDIQGEGENLDDVIVPFANATGYIIPIIVMAANAYIGEPDIEVAFDSTPNVSERDYFQAYVLPEGDVLHTARILNVTRAARLIESILKHTDAERLMRGLGQYVLALAHWRVGKEILAVAHLWMAIEAITEVRIRTECLRQGLSEVELVEKQQCKSADELKKVIRRDFLFQGDIECYKDASRASNGFEHGFMRLSEISQKSSNVRDRTATYVRHAILEMSGLDDNIIKDLISDPYHTPLGHWPLLKYLRGKLIGSSNELAAPGNAYPFVRWGSEIKTYAFDGSKMEIQVNENLTPEIADGIRIQLKSHEVWEPH